MKTASNSQKLQAAIGIIVSVLLIYQVFRQVDIASIGQALQRTKGFWVIVALIFYWVELALRVNRWKRILASVDNTIKYSSVSNAFCVSAAANNIFPFRFGDIIRAHLVGIQRKLSRYSLMGTIALEKLIDVVAVLFLTCLGAFGVLSQLGAMSKVGFAILLISVSLLLLAGIYLVLKTKYLSSKVILFLHERFGNFKKGFGILFRPKNFSFVIMETMVIWTFNTLAIWAIIYSLDITLSISEVLLLEGMCGLAAAIPSAPAGIGTMQYAFFLAFGIMQLDQSVGIAASLLVQGILLGSITLVGILIFTLDAKSRQALRKIRHE